MARAPVTGLLSQYAKNAGGAAASSYWLKFYNVNTTTQKSIYTAITAGSTLSKCTLNSRGEPISNQADDDSTFIPYVDGDYDAYLYETEADADANNTIAAVFLGRHETLPESLGDVALLQFATVNALISKTSLNYSETIDWSDYLGRKVSTVVHNTTSNAGDAEYVITNVNPGNLSTLIGGIWVGANHDLGGGYYAKMVIAGPVLVSQCGASFDGSDDAPAILSADATGEFIIDGPVYIDTNTTLTNKFSALFGRGVEITKGLGVSFLTPANAVVWAEWFGAVPDYNYTTKTGTNNGPKFRSALNTGSNVMIGVGSFGLEGTLQGNKMQVLSGFGNPQRGSKEEPSMTELIWMDDVDGISTDDNDANGFVVKELVMRADYQQANFTSTKTGLKFGVDGASGGTSSQIKCKAENILIINFFVGVGVHGFGYETILDNVLVSNFIDYGFRVTDQSNIVTLRDCGALNGVILGGGLDCRGLYVSEAHQVAAYTFRSENNRVGIEVANGGSLYVSNSYSEGNRIIDYLVNNEDTQLVIDSYRVFHENEGATTAAIFSLGASAVNTSFVARNGSIKVTKGAVGGDNNLTQMFQNSSTDANCYNEFTDIAWNAVGPLWTGYGPNKLTLRSLPHLEVGRRGYGSTASVSTIKTTVSGAPADAAFTLTNYDGTTQLVGKGIGARAIRMDASTVDFYYYDGAAWQTSNK